MVVDFGDSLQKEIYIQNNIIRSRQAEKKPRGVDVTDRFLCINWFIGALISVSALLVCNVKSCAEA